MRVTLLSLLMFAAVSLIGPTANARIIYVDNQGGDDRLDGRQERPDAATGPVRTINQALHIAEPGDRILLANTGEPYRECIALSAANHSGSERWPLVIDGRGATLDGSLPVPPKDWAFAGGNLFRFQPKQVTHQQLFLDGKPLVRRMAEGSSDPLPELQPLEWCLHDMAIYFRPEDGKLPRDYNLSYTALPVGITLDHVHDVAIGNLTVQGYYLDGINAHDGVKACQLGNLTLRGNGRSGLAVAGCSHVALTGSTVGNNGLAQLYTEALSKTVVAGSHLLENTAPRIVQKGGMVFVDGQPATGTPTP